MEKLLSNLKITNDNENLISLTLFGSYNTKYWFEWKSDIDILALIKKNDFNVEFEIENKYREVLQKYFNLDIFLESSSEVVRLNYKINKWLEYKNSLELI